MPNVTALPLGNYANGTHGPFGPVDIADNVTSVLISIQRCTSADLTIWPNATTILTMTPEVSIDGGVTWIEAGKSVSPGGILIRKLTGLEVPVSESGGSLPAPQNGITRKYRVTIDIVGGPLRSSATIEVL